MTISDLKTNHRILVIDDNPAIHKDFRKVLCPDDSSNPALAGIEKALFDDTQASVPRMRFQLDSAYQGQDGLELVKKAVAENCPYAMAFVDVRMPPGWDGVETITR